MSNPHDLWTNIKVFTANKRKMISVAQDRRLISLPVYDVALRGKTQNAPDLLRVILR